MGGRGHTRAPQPLPGLQELLQQCLRQGNALAGGSLLLQPLSPSSQEPWLTPLQDVSPGCVSQSEGHVPPGVGSCYNHCKSHVAESNTGMTCLLIPKQGLPCSLRAPCLVIQTLAQAATGLQRRGWPLASQRLAGRELLPTPPSATQDLALQGDTSWTPPPSATMS